MKKKITLLIATSMLLMASIASADNQAGTFSFTPVVGVTLFDGRQHLKINDLYGARLGYNFTDALGIEGLFNYSHNNKSTNEAVNAGISMYRYGGELLYHFIPENMVVPYVAAGYTGVEFDGDSDGFTNKNYKHTKGAFDYGVGVKIFVNNNVALRGDVRHVMYKYDQSYNNIESTVGVYFAFGGTRAVAKQVEPAPVPVVQSLDNDGDGVADTLDKCSNTPPGASVGTDGCPVDAIGTVDTDNDGVADSQDKCFNTPLGVAVGPDGCPR